MTRAAKHALSARSVPGVRAPREGAISSSARSLAASAAGAAPKQRPQAGRAEERQAALVEDDDVRRLGVIHLRYIHLRYVFDQRVARSLCGQLQTTPDEHSCRRKNGTEIRA